VSDDWGLCTVCGGIGRVRKWQWVRCEACVNGEPIGPRLIHRLAEEFARQQARDPWLKSEIA